MWPGGQALWSPGDASLKKILVTFSGGATRRIFSAGVVLVYGWGSIRSHKWVFGNLCGGSG